MRKKQRDKKFDFKSTQNINKKLILGIIFIFSVSCFSFIASAESYLVLNPPINTVSPREQFNITLEASNVTDLYAYQANINYNPNIINLTGIEEGNFLKSDGTSTFFYSKNASDSPSPWTVIGTRIGPVTGINGNGVLAKIMFKALNTGTSYINITDDMLLDSNSLEIAHVNNNAVVNVGGCISNNDCTSLNTVCSIGICSLGQCQRQFNSSTDICRASAGECDVEEKCTGNSENCPSDLFKPDGTICSNGTCQNGICIIQGQCFITNVNWSKNIALENEKVNIYIKGNNCEGKLMNITIMEKDILTNNDEVENFKINFSSNIEWSAKWQRDEIGNPEYYIKIAIDGNIFESSKDSDKLLVVTPDRRRYREKSIKLNRGKNLFSPPVIPLNLSVEEVFEDVKENITKIYTYEGGFKIYNFDGKPSNLKELEPGKGYVVIMKNDSLLIINGTKEEPDLSYPEFSIKQGWNLIGTFSMTTQIANLFSNTDPMKIYIFNKTSNSFEIIQDINQNLSETEGYWIYSNEQINFTPIMNESEEFYEIKWNLKKFFKLK